MTRQAPHARPGERRPGDRSARPDPARDDTNDPALARASAEVVTRLTERGVRLSGRESSEQLVDLLDAVERFERSAEREGADLMVDEPLPGAEVPTEPDDPAFVLRVRGVGEPIGAFITRIDGAGARATRGRRAPRGADRA